MIRTSYISRARLPMPPEQLLALLQQCLANNRRQGITGMLLYGNQTFLQVLEGEEAVVDELIARIRKDTRHTDMEVLHRAPIEHRQYTDWSMAFKRISDDVLQQIEGLRDFNPRDLNVDFLRKNDAVVEKLKDHFRAPHWDPLISELDANEKVIEHLRKMLVETRGQVEIATLVLESMAEAGRKGGLNASHLGLCEAALDSLRQP